MAIGVVLAEPNGDLARMLRLLLELSGDLRVLAVADDIAVAIARGKALRPAVLVADADLMRRAEATPASLRAALPGSSLLILAPRSRSPRRRPGSGCATCRRMSRRGSWR